MNWHTTLSITDDPIPAEVLEDPRNEDRPSAVLIEIRVDTTSQRIGVIARTGFDPNRDGFENLVAFLGSVAEMAERSIKPSELDLVTQELMKAGLSADDAVEAATNVLALRQAKEETEAFGYKIEPVERSYKGPRHNYVSGKADTGRCKECGFEPDNPLHFDQEPRFAPTQWQQEQIEELMRDEGMTEQGATAYVQQSQRIGESKRKAKDDAEAASRKAHPAGKGLSARELDASVKAFNPRPSFKPRS